MKGGWKGGGGCLKTFEKYGETINNALGVFGQQGNRLRRHLEKGKQQIFNFISFANKVCDLIRYNEHLVSFLCVFNCKRFYIRKKKAQYQHKLYMFNQLWRQPVWQQIKLESTEIKSKVTFVTSKPNKVLTGDKHKAKRRHGEIKVHCSPGWTNTRNQNVA